MTDHSHRRATQADSTAGAQPGGAGGGVADQRLVLHHLCGGHCRCQLIPDSQLRQVSVRTCRAAMHIMRGLDNLIT